MSSTFEQDPFHDPDFMTAVFQSLISNLAEENRNRIRTDIEKYFVDKISEIDRELDVKAPTQGFRSIPDHNKKSRLEEEKLKLMKQQQVMIARFKTS